MDPSSPETVTDASPPLSEQPDSRTRRTREQDEALLKEWAVEAMVGEHWYVTARRETVWNLFEERDALRAQVSTLTDQRAARSRRSEQEADALIEGFRLAVASLEEAEHLGMTEAASLAKQRVTKTAAALRTALLEPSADAGEDARRDVGNAYREGYLQGASDWLNEEFPVLGNILKLADKRFAARAATPGVSPEVSNG